MTIIGCDLHTRYQQIAMVDTDPGEMLECRLEHGSGEARRFMPLCTDLAPANPPLSR